MFLFASIYTLGFSIDCNNFFNPQRRSGKASSDVQILKIDEDLTGSRTEYMKVEIFLYL